MSSDFNQQQQYGQPNTPYGYQPEQNQQRNADKTVVWVLGTIGGIFLLGLLICCGVGYWGYTGFQQAMTEGMTEQMTEEYGEHPIIQDEIGEIESVSMQFLETVKETQKNQREGAPEVSSVSMNIKGDKGEGKIIINIDTRTNTQKVVFVDSDGEEHLLEEKDRYGRPIESEDSDEDESSQDSPDEQRVNETELEPKDTNATNTLGRSEADTELPVQELNQ